MLTTILVFICGAFIITCCNNDDDNPNVKMVTAVTVTATVSDLISAIKEDEEKKEERNCFDATLEQTKEANTLLQQSLDATKETTKF